MKLLDNISCPQDLQVMEVATLPHLAQEIRDFLIDITSKNGGHLGANLGVVELTIALHYCFNSPQDTIIWDIGHQSYVHKILTGRKNQMQTVRKPGGISGFALRSESIHDAFGAGHSSTSISAGLGFNVAKPSDWSIAVIGDSAMSAGLAYEALNNAASASSKFMVILNDNEMSISKPVGAMSKYLSRLFASKEYHSMKNFGKTVASKVSQNFADFASHMAKSMKGIIAGGNVFEEFGFEYIGPVDGHDVKELIHVMEMIKCNTSKKPIFLHIITKKGKGYSPAENADDKFHGVKPFDVKTGEQSRSMVKSWSLVASENLFEYAKDDKSIVVITPAMIQGSALENFAQNLPNQLFDVGIAEQHAITFSGGLAAAGRKPYCFIYSTFLQRGYDNLIHDIALQNLSVRFMIDRAGLTPEDGPTHHGIFDVAFTRIIPNMVIISPSDDLELKMAIKFSLTHEGPLCIRYPRGSCFESGIHSESFTIGNSRFVQRKSSDALVISVGGVLPSVIKHYADADIVDVRFIKPLDENIVQMLPKYKNVYVVEESSIGAVFSIILEESNRLGINTCHVKRIILPDVFGCMPLDFNV